VPPPTRGLHSSTFQLNLSALYGIGGARGDCLARIKGVSGGAWGVKGVFVCQIRLKLSWEVNECKPLPPTAANEPRLRGRKRLGRESASSAVRASCASAVTGEGGGGRGAEEGCGGGGAGYIHSRGWGRRLG